MDLIELLIGTGKQLNSLQMGVRTIIVFVVALCLLRIAGMRTLGKKSAFDMVIIIMLGAVLSRPIIGASPFIPTIVASMVMVIIHRFVGWLSFKSAWIGRLVNGERKLLYKKGERFEKNMENVQISTGDVTEEVRIQMHQEGLDDIEEIWLEKSGKISMVKYRH